MASYFRIFWRKQRRLVKLPPLDRYAPPPPPPEPVSAWTPHFQRTRNNTNRHRADLPAHNSEYPQTPIPPFPLAAINPAKSIKRREIRRQRIPSPFHHDKPLTTRITHLTASVLYGQGPPATRATHLTAMVLYKRPTSQGVPENDRKEPQRKGKRKWSAWAGGEGFHRRRLRLPPHFVYPLTPKGFFEGFYPGSAAVTTLKSLFDRKLQTLAIPPVYPPPPAAPISVVAETAALKARRTSFKRTLQAPLELNERPATPVPIVSVVAETPVLKVNRISFHRSLQRLPHPEATPAAAPPAISVVAETPALKANRTSFKRTLQRLPHPQAAPVTQISVVAETRALAPFTVQFERKRQSLPQLDEYPPTLAGFFDGFYPGSKRVEGFRTAFDRTIQTLAIPSVYPPPPVSADDYPALTPALSANQITFDRQILPVLNPHVYPPTPLGFVSGFWPAQLTLTPFKVSVERVLVEPLELNERPPTPPVPISVVAQTPTLKANRTSFKRTLQTLAHPEATPATPAPAISVVAETPVLKANRTSFDRMLQKLPHPEATPAAAPPAISVVAETPALRANRVSFARQRQDLLPLEARPPTPAGFFDGFYPGSAIVFVNRSSFDRQLVSLPQHDQWTLTPAVVPYPSFLEKTAIRRTALRRNSQISAEINEYPATPPSIIEMPAMWAAQSIRRRETRRTIQPVWNPASVVGEGFVLGLTACWFADPINLEWKADCATTTFTADEVC